MTKFFAGLTFGLFIGICVTSYAATIVGNTPTLEGWTVTYGDNTICTDPEVNFKDKEIECAGGDPRDPIDPLARRITSWPQLLQIFIWIARRARARFLRPVVFSLSSGVCGMKKEKRPQHRDFDCLRDGRFGRCDPYCLLRHRPQTETVGCKD